MIKTTTGGKRVVPITGAVAPTPILTTSNKRIPLLPAASNVQRKLAGFNWPRNIGVAV